MSFPARVEKDARTHQTPVTIALLGQSVPDAAELSSALAAAGGGVDWLVVLGLAADSVDLAVCDTVRGVLAAGERWPGVAVLAVVGSADDSDAVVAVLSAGADVCMHRGDARLTAAYVHAIARRRGLLTGAEEAR